MVNYAQINRLAKKMKQSNYFRPAMKNTLFIFWIIATIHSVFAQQTRSSLDPSLRPFYHGVASGDPLADQVIIWTRVTPDSGSTNAIEVFWQIATDTNFNNIVNYGKLTATEQNDFCVKQDVCGLNPSTFYYYMFNALGRNSVMGRTKTAPAALSNNDSVRFAVVSCADYENGFFNAYESISNKNNVDAVVHLGDYIYEYEPGGISVSNPGGRLTEPDHEIVSMQDYRIRHSHYKLDNQLRRLHQLFPFITVWDDHETCNNSWRDGADNHQPATEGSYTTRKGVATNTYFDWMPLRKPDPNDPIRIFRTLRYGKLLDLVMLDTRLYDRDEPSLSATNDSSHKLMGPVEMNWFLQQLSDTSTRWKIIGNQVMFAPLQIFGQPFNSDQWDGYNYERQKIQTHLLQNNIKNFVVLTGDIHTSWCNDIPGPNYNSNTGAGSVGVEFVGTSVTSLNSPFPIGSGIIKSLNPHMKYINLANHGYYTLDVNKNRVQADYTFVETDQPTFSNQEVVSYYVNNQESYLKQGSTLLNVPQLTGPIPPTNAKQNIGFLKIDDQYTTIPENTQANTLVIPSLQVCPTLNLSILQGKHGATISLNGQNATYVPQQNYFGYDTVGFVTCTNTIPTACDTVYWYITITAVQDVDTVIININDSTLYTNCIIFDDLSSPAVSVQYNTPINGLLSVTDTCFEYLSNKLYCGKETIVFTACDAATNCDTVVYIFKVNVPVTAGSYSVAMNKNTNVSLCTLFDDLVCTASNLQVIKNPTNGTFQVVGDSCLKYFPFFNYTGTDTLLVVGCDTCAANHCDTTMVSITITEPVALPSINFTVLSIYPNPASSTVAVQYYLFEPQPVSLKLYTTNVQLVMSENAGDTSVGLHYATLNLSNVPAGQYLLEIKCGATAYTKAVVKQ